MSDDLISEDDPVVVKLEECLKALEPLFDSVHITATRKCRDGRGTFTDTISRGNGNAAARFGSLKFTVLKLEEEARWQMRQALDHPDEEPRRAIGFVP